MAAIKDFGEGAISKVLVNRNSPTGYYRIEYKSGVLGEIEALAVSVPEVVMDVFTEYMLGDNKLQTRENLARAILREIGAKENQDSVYFAAHINEPGMQQVTVFLTLEHDHYKRFMKGWKKYAPKP